ncbi:MAG TPA: tetratricopeptide repeat protein, partial [Chitinophaga sp.]
LAGAYKITNLQRSWPFHDPHPGDSTQVAGAIPELAYGLAFRHLDWGTVMDQLYQDYVQRNDLEKAGRIAEALVLEHPAAVAYAQMAANVYGKMGRLSDAAFYFRQAFNIAPTFETARNIFVIYLKEDEPMKAMPYLDYAMAHNDRGMNLAPVKQFAAAVIQLQLAAQKTPGDAEILKQIAHKYYEMGNTDGAMKYVQMALKVQPGDAGAQTLLAQLKKV